MNNEEKSIAYAFIANGVHIYLNEEDYFIISKLICADCGHSWYMNLTECFLCGAINPFLYQCNSCGFYQSITKSSGKCNSCNSIELYMHCPNPDCISNKDDSLLKEADNFGGVFNKNSGLLIAQQYCINCGSKHHKYQNYKVAVKTVSKKEFSYDELNLLSTLTEDAYVIIRYKENDGSLKYSLLKHKDINKDIKLTKLFDNFADVVGELFPIKT